MAHPIKLIPELTEKQTRNFWRKIKVAGDNDCWEWQASLNAYGYGQFNIDGRIFAAHRISYVLANGEFPPDRLHTLHSCDNPKCQNPAHISAGTPADNMNDKTDKGRGNQPKGENHHWRGQRSPNSKLTEQSVVEIRRRFSRGRITKASLAKEFRVSHQCIAQIIARTVWAHVE